MYSRSLTKMISKQNIKIPLYISGITCGIFTYMKTKYFMTTAGENYCDQKPKNETAETLNKYFDEIKYHQEDEKEKVKKKYKYQKQISELSQQIKKLKALKADSKTIEKLKHAEEETKKYDLETIKSLNSQLKEIYQNYLVRSSDKYYGHSKFSTRIAYTWYQDYFNINARTEKCIPAEDFDIFLKEYGFSVYVDSSYKIQSDYYKFTNMIDGTDPSKGHMETVYVTVYYNKELNLYVVVDKYRVDYCFKYRKTYYSNFIIDGAEFVGNVVFPSYTDNSNMISRCINYQNEIEKKIEKLTAELSIAQQKGK
jgi:hypothetical protein